MLQLLVNRGVLLSFYEHNFIHYFAGFICWIVAELVLAFVYLIMSTKYPMLNLTNVQGIAVLLVLALFIAWVIIVKKFDYIWLEAGYIEAKHFNFSSFRVESLSTSKSKIRACEYSVFLCWNKVVIKGPLGVTLTMYNIKNMKELVSKIRDNW